MIYFRITSLASTPLLLPLILSRSRKRNYPTYTPTRTIEIFPTRDDLLAYEAALVVESRMEEAFDGGNAAGTRIERAEKALVVMESVKERWRELAMWVKEGGNDVYRRPGLERFEEGELSRYSASWTSIKLIHDPQGTF